MDFSPQSLARILDSTWKGSSLVKNPQTGWAVVYLGKRVDFNPFAPGWFAYLAEHLDRIQNPQHGQLIINRLLQKDVENKLDAVSEAKNREKRRAEEVAEEDERRRFDRARTGQDDRSSSQPV